MRAKRAAQATEGELRRVSILFADIRNSTAMLQHLDAEEAAALLDPPLDAMREAVARFDGVVSHLGDGILAVFGAPAACEDHAVRACLAALSIQDALGRLKPVQVRIGIHTGDVVMRERRIGRAQIWEPVGPALTVAARIEQGAEPGTISVSATTAEGARGFVEVTALPALAARGFDAALPVARVTAAEPGASRWTVRSANGLVEMVDRTAEQAVLRACVRGSGHGTVQVSGPPGIGKSRLLHEALRAADPASTQVVRLAGNPHRQDSPFHPFAVWLRALLDIRTGDPASVVPGRLVHLAGLPPQGLDALARILGQRADAAVPATAMLAAMASAVASLLHAGADGRRTVLSCEDLDCFDGDSRALLGAMLAEDGPAAGTTLIATSRTRLRLPGPGTAYTLHLQPLGEPDTLQLLFRIDHRFATRPDLFATLQARTGGNPLFIEEIVARTRPALDGDAHEAMGEIPDRVEALVADRLNRLPRGLKRMVQLSAVLGGTVPLRLLARLADIGEAALHRDLLRLQSEQVLTETRRYPDPEFEFRNGLTREAAYRTILAARRRELHARARDLLETVGGLSGNRLDDMCFHALGAQDWARAAVHLREAASLAAGASAYQVARQRLDQALEALRRLPETEARRREELAMRLDMPLMLRAAGRYAEVGAALDAAEALARGLADRPAVAGILAQRVHLLNIAGRMDEAVAVGREAHAAASAAGDPALLVLVSHNLAQAHYNRGEVRACIEVLDRVRTELALAGNAARPGSIGSLPVLVHATLTFALTFAGDHGRAQEAAEAALGGAIRSGRPYDRAFAALAGGLARLRHAPQEAEALLLDGLAVCETGQIDQAVPPLQSALGHLKLRMAAWVEAADWLERARAGSRAQARSMVGCWATAGLARARWETGRRDEARTLATEALDAARGAGYRGYLAIGLRLCAALEAPEAAVAMLREAAALADELDLRGELADCRAALALVRPGG